MYISWDWNISGLTLSICSPNQTKDMHDNNLSIIIHLIKHLHPCFLYQCRSHHRYAPTSVHNSGINSQHVPVWSISNSDLSQTSCLTPLQWYLTLIMHKISHPFLFPLVCTYIHLARGSGQKHAQDSKFFVFQCPAEDRIKDKPLTLAECYMAVTCNSGQGNKKSQNQDLPDMIWNLNWHESHGDTKCSNWSWYYEWSLWYHCGHCLEPQWTYYHGHPTNHPASRTSIMHSHQASMHSGNSVGWFGWKNYSSGTCFKNIPY